MAGLSADYEIECRILENNRAGLNRTEIERVRGNQYKILLRQQQASKTLEKNHHDGSRQEDERKTPQQFQR